jgi:hypothetical protein
LELKRLAAEIVNIITCINTRGLDMYFLNRAPLRNVTTPAGLQAVFSVPPSGSTPLVGCLQQIHRERMGAVNSSGRTLLLVVITDGEPAGGPLETRENLRQTLINLTASGKIHVSFAECTDQADDMEVRNLCIYFTIRTPSVC